MLSWWCSSTEQERVRLKLVHYLLLPPDSNFASHVLFNWSAIDWCWYIHTHTHIHTYNTDSQAESHSFRLKGVPHHTCLGIGLCVLLSPSYFDRVLFCSPSASASASSRSLFFLRAVARCPQRVKLLVLCHFTFISYIYIHALYLKDTYPNLRLTIGSDNYSILII